MEVPAPPLDVDLHELPHQEGRGILAGLSGAQRRPRLEGVLHPDHHVDGATPLVQRRRRPVHVSLPPVAAASVVCDDRGGNPPAGGPGPEAPESRDHGGVPGGQRDHHLHHVRRIDPGQALPRSGQASCVHILRPHPSGEGGPEAGPLQRQLRVGQLGGGAGHGGPGGLELGLPEDQGAGGAGSPLPGLEAIILVPGDAGLLGGLKHGHRILGHLGPGLLHRVGEVRLLDPHQHLPRGELPSALQGRADPLHPSPHLGGKVHLRPGHHRPIPHHREGSVTGYHRHGGHRRDPLGRRRPGRLGAHPDQEGGKEDGPHREGDNEDAIPAVAHRLEPVGSEGSAAASMAGRSTPAISSIQVPPRARCTPRRARA